MGTAELANVPPTIEQCAGGAGPLEEREQEYKPERTSSL